ncbi:MAG: glycosyltransferase family 1 protein [Planctomycetota bacterium]|nr:glycosyltransferase family 1 protein [Planctomycetota bacterium]
MSQPLTIDHPSISTVRRNRKLLSIAHSYVVALNRRLAQEMSRVGVGDWEVTAVAPDFFHGDLRPVYLEYDEREPCRLVPVPVRFSRKVHVMLYGSRLKRLVQDEKWDLVHCWEEPFIVAAGQVARWTPPGTPLVFWTAQNLSKSYPPPFRWIERQCIDRCSGWMACGESIVRAMLTRGYGSKPHRIMPLGVDSSRFRPDSAAREWARRKLGWSEPGPPVVGYVGRFVAEKGLHVMMHALDAVTTPWRALLLGGGPMEGELRRWASKYPGRAIIAPAVKHDEVPAYINAMDLLLAPSQTAALWREQFGRMLIEAFACGVPVLASDSGEIPFVVADAGRIVPEGDESAWASAIGEILNSPNTREEMRRNGIERVAGNYTWPIVARRHLDFFDELLDAPACR